MFSVLPSSGPHRKRSSRSNLGRQRIELVALRSFAAQAPCSHLTSPCPDRNGRSRASIAGGQVTDLRRHDPSHLSASRALVNQHVSGA